MDRAGTDRRAAGGVRRRTLAIAALVTTIAAGATLLGTAHATASPPQIPGSLAAPTAAEISPMCTTTDPGLGARARPPTCPPTRCPPW